MKTYGMLRRLWGRFRYRFCMLLFKDIIQEELTDAMHPEFGYIWRSPDGEAYKAILQAHRNGYEEARERLILNPDVKAFLESKSNTDWYK